MSWRLRLTFVAAPSRESGSKTAGYRTGETPGIRRTEYGVGAVGLHHRVGAIGKLGMVCEGQRADPRRGSQDLASSDEAHAFGSFPTAT